MSLILFSLTVANNLLFNLYARKFKNSNLDSYTSCYMTKPTKWPVHPAKNEISLGICPVWPESSLCALWVAKDPMLPHADSKDSDQTGWMPRLIWVCWVHRSFCWFCHVAAHITVSPLCGCSTIFQDIRRMKALCNEKHLDSKEGFQPRPRNPVVSKSKHIYRGREGEGVGRGGGGDAFTSLWVDTWFQKHAGFHWKLGL